MIYNCRHFGSKLSIKSGVTDRSAQSHLKLQVTSRSSRFLSFQATKSTRLYFNIGKKPIDKVR